jgi:hypothetical protein
MDVSFGDAVDMVFCARTKLGAGFLSRSLLLLTYAASSSSIRIIVKDAR